MPQINGSLTNNWISTNIRRNSAAKSFQICRHQSCHVLLTAFRYCTRDVSNWRSKSRSIHMRGPLFVPNVASQALEVCQGSQTRQPATFLNGLGIIITQGYHFVIEPNRLTLIYFRTVANPYLCETNQSVVRLPQKFEPETKGCERSIYTDGTESLGLIKFQAVERK
jgi:hypothetical protein